MVEPFHRFGRGAIDELNGQKRPPTNKQFVLLLIGLAIFIAVLYAMIALTPPNWTVYGYVTSPSTQNANSYRGDSLAGRSRER
jgi:hypothetical protein